MKKSQEQIRVVVVEPKKAPQERQIGNDLASMQEIVGGYIEAVALNDNLVLICNEEGKIQGLEPNRFIAGDVIVGTFFVTRSTADGGFTDLSDNDVKQLIEYWS